MAKAKKTPSAALKLIATIAERHGITAKVATALMLKFLEREKKEKFINGWGMKLLDAQFIGHVGPFKRIRCGRERHLSFLTPGPGQYCHDCGCVRGEYHVFGCDSEECSNCGDQAFCCGCDDESESEQRRS
jgi:hypothetical protein